MAISMPYVPHYTFKRQTKVVMKPLFQSDEYLLFLEQLQEKRQCKLEPFRTVWIRDENEVGRIAGYTQQDGGRIKRFLSRRAIINGGPYLAPDITEEELTFLLRTCIKQLKGKAIYIETRNFQDYSAYRQVFESCGFVYEPHYDFIINTESLEIAESNLGKSRKRDIRTSLRDGAVVVENPTKEQIESFYAILKDLYESKVKTPVFPLDFFIKLSETSFAKFILIQYEGRIIGGTVCVFDYDTVYEWFACGQDGVYKNIFPSTLATWSGIRFAAESGHSRFDMMGAGAPGDGGYGVREFKAKFGGELVEYGRFKYVCNKPLYSIGEFGVKMMKKR